MIRQTQYNLNVIFSLQAEARKVLDAIIPADAHIILLDYPNTTNVGDSLIWLGEMAYLSSRSLKPKYVCDIENYDKNNIKKLLNEKSVLLMHGGGNFGTVWKKIHNFRLQVLKDFIGTKIVQFPQTIHFDDADKIKEMTDVIRQHGNYCLLARSNKSYAFAKHHFDTELYLCPDMAFFIGEIKHLSVPIFDRFILSRTDHEKSSEVLTDTTQFSQNSSYQVTDWLQPSQCERFLHRLQMHSIWLRKVLDPNNLLLLNLWNHLSKTRMHRGIKLLASGRIVLTDRLHAHILSILINRPHVITDNCYGKVSDFYQTWTFKNIQSVFVSDTSRLHAEADQLDALMQVK